MTVRGFDRDKGSDAPIRSRHWGRGQARARAHKVAQVPNVAGARAHPSSLCACAGVLRDAPAPPRPVGTSGVRALTAAINTEYWSDAPTSERRPQARVAMQGCTQAI